MATYTQLSQFDGKAIAELYGLNFQSLEAIEAGSENSNFLLRAEEGKYILTMIEVKPIEAVEQMVRLHQYLEEQQFPAPRMLAPSGTKMVGEYKDKPILIKKHIAGEQFEQLDADQLQILGKQLAELNKLPSPSFAASAPAFGRQWMASLLQEKLNSEFSEWLENKLKSFDTQEWDELPKGLIHADLFLDNVIFKDGQVAAILDFEEACQYMLLFDLGMAIVGCCREDDTISIDKARQFIAGHQELRPLTSSEREALPIFIAYGAASTACWRYWKFNLLQAAPGKEERYKEMMALSDWANSLNWRDLLI